MSARLPAALLLLALALVACTTPPAPREPARDRLDPRIVPLTLEQQRQIAE